MKKTLIGLGLFIGLTLFVCMPLHAEDWMAKGNEALKMPDFKGAVEAYRNAIKGDPSNEKAWRAYEDALICHKADELLTMSDTLPLWIFKAQPDVVQEIREKKDIFLIDVRRLKELEEFQLAETHHIDLKNLAKSLGELPKDKSRYIVVMCKTGARASVATTALRMMGYTNAWALISARMPEPGGVPSMTLILGNEAKKK
jgi:rhodanese-related sulfurtransferase